jgi:hypothetical protein
VWSITARLESILLQPPRTVDDAHAILAVVALVTACLEVWWMSMSVSAFGRIIGQTDVAACISNKGWFCKTTAANPYVCKISNNWE